MFFASLGHLEEVSRAVLAKSCGQDDVKFPICDGFK